MSAEKQDEKLPETQSAETHSAETQSAETQSATAPEAEHGSESGETRKPPSFGQVMLSVIAAAFGVQTGKNYERDFSTGNPLAYIAGGLLFTVLFVLTIAGVVSLVLP